MAKRAGKPKRAAGPVPYRESLASVILERVGEGETLTEVCADLGVHRASILHWREERPDFEARYARAKEMQADAVFDELDSIANGLLDGTIDYRAAAPALEIQRFRLERMSEKYA